MGKRNLKDECEKMGVIFFDCAGTARREDILKGLDVIGADLSQNSDEVLFKHIEKINEQKKTARFKGVMTE